MSAPRKKKPNPAGKRSGPPLRGPSDATDQAADLGASIMGLPGAAVTPKKGGKPAVGESSGPQNTFTGMPFPMGGFLAAAYGMAGGGALGPGGFGNGWGGLFPGGYPGISLAFGGAMYGFGASGFIQPRKGSYATYRLMDVHPTLRLVKQLIVGPIMASQWNVQPADWAKEQQQPAQKTPGQKKAAPQGYKPKLDGQKLDNAVQLIKEMILPLRQSFMSEALRYLSSGWRPFEQVWQVRDGLYWLQKLKPLLPELTNILHDGKGNFAGLTQLSQRDSLDPNKSFLVTYDNEAGNLYGYSRHEAAYDPWVDWQSSRIRRWLTGNKLAGYLPILYYRPGLTQVGSSKIDNGQIAKQILAAAGMGQGAAVPTTEYTDEDLQNNPELVKIAPWRLEITDCGSYAPAIEGMIKESEYDDKLLVRAWGWPERALLEAQRSGSRADSQQHSDNSQLDRELIDDDLAQQVTRGQPSQNVSGIVQNALSLNVGDDYRDAIEVVPAPLVDQKVEVYTKILVAMLADQNVGPLIFSKINDDAVLDHLDIDKSADPDEKLAAILDVASKQKMPAELDDELSQQGEAQQTGKPARKPAASKSKLKSKKRPQAAKLLSQWLDSI